MNLTKLRLIALLDNVAGNYNTESFGFRTRVVSNSLFTFYLSCLIFIFLQPRIHKSTPFIATDLKNKDTMGQSDPYIKFEMEQDNMLKDKNYGEAKSTTKKNELSPVYGETVSGFPLVLYFATIPILLFGIKLTINKLIQPKHSSISTFLLSTIWY